MDDHVVVAYACSVQAMKGAFLRTLPGCFFFLSLEKARCWLWVGRWDLWFGSVRFEWEGRIEGGKILLHVMHACRACVCVAAMW
jgi:hypothetical protein